MPFVVETSSVLHAGPQEVWAAVRTMAGVNRELAPWVRMTYPDESADLALEDAPPGSPVFQSWLLLLGGHPLRPAPARAGGGRARPPVPGALLLLAPAPVAARADRRAPPGGVPGHGPHHVPAPAAAGRSGGPARSGPPVPQPSSGSAAPLRVAVRPPASMEFGSCGDGHRGTWAPFPWLAASSPTSPHGPPHALALHVA